MAEGSTPAKKLKTEHSSLPECPYGVNCYRKNPKHFEEFFHSKAQKDSEVSPSDEKSESTDVSSKQIPVPDSSLPLCKYGTSCYRKNLLHFAEYSHPISGPTKDTNSSDTDVISSPVELTEAKNHLNKGMSLVKKFSQMTEIERKELIKKAIEEKLRLEQELENTKKIVAEKDKELNQLQKQLNNGLLMLDGEQEALNKDTTTYFSLYPERAYKEGSASQIHFRLAESQFYRLLTGDVSASIRVLKVDYVVSPKVVKRFRQCQENLKKTRGESFSYPILGFHGTDQKNIKPICENGFKAPGDRGFHHKTDSGWYGAGVYFSEFTKYSMNYISGCSQLMLCQILPGKVYECSGLIHGAKLQAGYDSHMSPCKKEVVIFDTTAILPCYIIYFENAKGEFSYSGTMSHLYKEAASQKSSKVFKGMTFALFGKLADSQASIFKLLSHHDAKKGAKGKVDVLITTEEDGIGTSKVILEAKKQNIPIVREEYIYQCILQKKKLVLNDYKL
ncbi:hypothetical protein Btru_019414 [Bulinus truncatus]|nr:hypothetical protein Btru_019414 [Bulinus truncatus]